MPPPDLHSHDWGSLWQSLGGAAELDDRQICGPRAALAFAALRTTSSLGGRLNELAGRCVLLAAKDQLTAALALIELDGIARRIVLCPPDLAPEHMAPIAATADVDVAVLDEAVLRIHSFAVPHVMAGGAALAPAVPDRTARHATEWILLTSGTTGVPKLVLHTLASLAGPVTGAPVPPHAGHAARPVWSTFYDIRRYGGLQIFLRAVLGGGSMVLSDPDEPTADFLARAGASGVTHISGTPSHWRRALMSPQIHGSRSFKPGYVRLSGEIADQPVLDKLRQCFPESSIAHAFASTEAGVAFDVSDGRAGFPEGLIGRLASGVEMRVEDGTLRIRSARTASRYLGANVPTLRGADGFVDTGDVVELTDGRYHFAGRRGGIINVGGAKVHPEEVEAVINRHPRVQMSLVRARRNPITGAVVVADIVTRAADADDSADEQLKRELMETCRAALPAHKVPATIRIVPSLEVGPAGKLVRQNA